MEENSVKGNNVNPVSKNKSGKLWKGVVFGDFPGILLGIGAIAGIHVFAKKVPFVNIAEGNDETADAANGANNANSGSENVVAPNSEANNPLDEMSFEEAFMASRSAQGPDGIFMWHGGVYSTHTQDEWDAMAPEKQNEAVTNAGVETPASEVDQLPTDENPEPRVSGMEPEVLVAGGEGNGETGIEGVEGDDNVAIVGVSEVDGHVAAQVDIDGDGELDITIVDMDDNRELSAQDMIIDNEGNSGTYAELASDPNGNAVEGENADYASNGDSSTYDNTDDLAASGDDSFLDNPEVAEDMPDYMNDAIV